MSERRRDRRDGREREDREDDMDKRRIREESTSRRKDDGRRDSRRSEHRDTDKQDREYKRHDRRQDPEPYSYPTNRKEEDKDIAKEKELPNYESSGLLHKDQNSYNGVVLKYSEPPEARKTNKKLRLYIFKGDEQIDLLHINKQSAYLVGRDRLVADIPIDHPSCSKQHAVFQYRQTTSKNEIGEPIKKTKLYIIDLESANGTLVNGEKIPTSRYVELKVSDVIKFGFSSRDYVLMDEDQI